MLVVLLQKKCKDFANDFLCKIENIYNSIALAQTSDSLELLSHHFSVPVFSSFTVHYDFNSKLLLCCEQM